ncbi:unnamed protein product, partial [Rotaria magnacalcarata]
KLECNALHLKEGQTQENTT